MLYNYDIDITRSLHNIKIGKNTIYDDPEDDKGNTPYQKYQFSPENKKISIKYIARLQI